MTWVLILFCFIVSFLLSGLESAVAAVSRVRVRHAASGGDARAASLLPLLEDREALLGCITVSNHIVNLTGFLLVALPLIDHASVMQVAVTFVLALPVFLIGLEVMPKKLFRRFPYRSIRKIAPLLHFVGIARPLFRAFTRHDTPAHPGTDEAMPAPSPDALPSTSRGDLKELASGLAAEQQLSNPAARLISRVLDYKKRSTGDVMQPLNRSFALSAELPISTALIIAREQRTRVLPVLGEDGSFIGVLDSTSLPISLPQDHLVRHHMRTIDTVQSTDPAMRTLQRLRKQGRRLAVVTDSQARPIGLITEDHLLSPLMQDAAPAAT